MNSIRINEFIRFGIVGCIAVVVQYAVYYLCLKFVSHNVSYTIGYIFSFIVNYILTTSFTFRIKKTGRNGVGFTFSHMVNYFMQV